MAKKYKIIDTVWHVMHFTRLAHALKDDVEFHLLYNSWRQWQTPRFLKARPIPENVKFVPYYDPAEKYDLAILHIDQQICNPSIGKVRIYDELNATIQGVPKVVINHGTPVYPEHLKVDDMTDADAEAEARRIVKEKMGDNLMVVNSHDAVKEWGFGHAITHGYNPSDWLDLLKEPRVFTALSPGGLEIYYNRECANEVGKILEHQYGYPLWWAKINCLQNTDEINGGDFNAYRNFLGRSLIYLDTSTRTPLNGARTEAMLSGACVVQVEGAHDLDRFAKPGENMILVPNHPETIAKTIWDLMENRFEEAIRIGQNGKKTAMEYFSVESYRKQWLDFIHNQIKI